jgi:adhesin transport system outer membrane protein
MKSEQMLPPPIASAPADATTGSMTELPPAAAPTAGALASSSPVPVFAEASTTRLLTPDGKPVTGTATRSLTAGALGPHITLEAAVRRAVDWHPSVDEAVGRVNQHAEQINVAKAGYYPKVRGGINSGYDSQQRDAWQPEFNVTASQMVYDFGKVASSVDAEAASTEVSRAELLLAVDTLIRETAVAVVEIQRNFELRRVAEDQLKGVEAIAALVLQRSDKGASTRSDQMQAEARVESAQATVLQISAELNRWMGTLATMIGSTGPVMPVSEMPPWLARQCNSGQPDWTQVPSMLQADARRKEAVALLARSRADIFPTLSVEAGAGYDFGDPSAEDFQSSNRPEYTVGLNVSGNLYEGGATFSRARSASYALSAADAARATAMVETMRRLKEARDQIGNLQTLLTSLSARTVMMNETRNLYRKQYLDLGTRTLLDLLNAEQELHAAQFDAVNTAHDLRRLNIDCMYNSGASRTAFGLAGAMVRGAPLQP